MDRLGVYYEYTEIDYDQMKKYYLMAIENGDTYAFYNLSGYYENNDVKFKQYIIENIVYKNEYNSIKNENEKLKKEIELLKLRPGGELYKEQEEKFNAVDME